MISLAKFSIRRPKTALAGWIALAVVLTIIGLKVDHVISPQVNASGTESWRAQQLADEKFGPSQLMPLLLEGPRAQLDKQGPKLVVALTKRGNTRVISAWDGGQASAGLRPKPNAAMIAITVPRTEKQVLRSDLPQIKTIVSQQVRMPVKAYLSGQAVLDQANKDESLHILQTAAVVAIGVLFVLLLLGLRAPLGAALVTVVAGSVTMSTFGLVYLLGHGGMEVDATVLASTAIAGLARGASYPLVMLDRFHRERDKHPNAPTESLVSEAVGTTGRALLYAGTVMIAALLVVEALGVTNVVATLGIGALLATVLATGAAVVVVPAGLALFGDAAVKWRLPTPAFLSGIWDRLVAVGDAVARYPLAFGALAAAALLAMAVPALGAVSGTQDISLLPAGNQARVAFEEINHVMGAGYLTPYQITVYNPNGPITSAATVAKLNNFEKKIAKDRAVKSVVGPGGSFYGNASQLKKVGPGLQNSIKVSKESVKGLGELINGLGLAGAGSAQLQSGLAQASSGAKQIHGGTTLLQSKSAEAASGAAQLHSGSGQAQSGAGQLHSGLAQAKAGSAKLQGGLNQALAGANALKNGSAQVLAGSNQLVNGLGKAQNGAKPVVPGLNALSGAASTTSTQVNAALAQLNAMTIGKSDPSYGAVQRSLTNAAGTAGATKALATKAAEDAPALIDGINQLNTGAGQLATGIEQLHNGNVKLANGISQLAGGGGQLTSGLSQLTAGAGALETGLGQLTNGTGQLASGLAGGLPQVGLLNAGTGQLASGLSAGVGPSGQLTAGLGTMRSEVIKSRGKVPSTRDLEKLFKSSPGLFSSGYFVLAAIAGAPPSDRNAANLVINLTRGGNAGQIIVTSRYPLNDNRVNQLGDRLRGMSASFAKANGMQSPVGGPAGSQWDTANVTLDKLPRVILGEVLVIGLLLMLLLRAILIPAVATLTAALTTASGFGVMQLLFGGTNPPLGGSGTWYSVIIVEVLAAIFGATLVYIVVLMSRARDYYVTSGDARGSVIRGMRSTIAATTGMATITIGVLIPFMLTEFLPIRIIAVAAALAVGLIAYVVIPVLLPAAMSLFGRAGWWPTRGPAPAAGAGESDTARTPERRTPKRRPHLPHRRPRPAH